MRIISRLYRWRHTIIWNSDEQYKVDIFVKWRDESLIPAITNQLDYISDVTELLDIIPPNNQRNNFSRLLDIIFLIISIDVRGLSHWMMVKNCQKWPKCALPYNWPQIWSNTTMCTAQSILTNLVAKWIVFKQIDSILKCTLWFYCNMF